MILPPALNAGNWPERMRRRTVLSETPQRWATSAGVRARVMRSPHMMARMNAAAS